MSTFISRCAGISGRTSSLGKEFTARALFALRQVWLSAFICALLSFDIQSL